MPNAKESRQPYPCSRTEMFIVPFLFTLIIPSLAFSPRLTPFAPPYIQPATCPQMSDRNHGIYEAKSRHPACLRHIVQTILSSRLRLRFRLFLRLEQVNSVHRVAP